MTQSDHEPASWRSEHIALATAALTVASPVAFIVLGWIAGALIAALAASAAVVGALSVRIERGELERRAQVAEEAAQAERRSKARVLSVLSHDLRQPLHALSLYAAALHKRIENPEARAIVDKMERAAQTTAALIARVDDHAQFSKMALEPRMETIALGPLLASVAAAHANLTAPATDVQVRTDPDLLRGLLNRLAENAARHGGGGRFEVHADDDEIEVSVIDNGPGIELGDQARIFEEFVRLDNASRGDGMGLGLAIAKRIADALGAELRVKSALGEGARFSFRTPRAV